MRLGKRYSRSAIVMAMVHGIFIGIAGVLIFGFILNFGNNINNAEGNDNNNELPVDSQEKNNPTDVESDDEKSAGDEKLETTTPYSFYALQHGVFTSKESATQFISTDPKLQETAIIPIEDKFYVWSLIGLSETEVKIQNSTDSFVKNFFVSSDQCTKAGEKKLANLLHETEVQKLNFGDTVSVDELPEKWAENVAAVSAFSKDIRIVRVQLLAHYSLLNDCLKINF